ncbi:hypothetical protein Psyc_1981 [Psychrobacter arcticus 273-4]|uniref:Uncharacterized protein n=1 Tax=Psychrobacter arcticus (strain DSM 17307 / VKM B-2377 / 273-4) TaxID=259536 RepID=Q4FQ80_PSYA2|nr:hypothetical protein [Psychrobacter arcticus]AAZ19828.1 hypothetical protein Psyc_1981 [Psychrobacter arcticus 273-4]
MHQHEFCPLHQIRQYYWGLTETLTATIDNQRWALVLLVALHVLLYLFVVIHYAQQIIAYNDTISYNDNDTTTVTAIVDSL